MNSIVRLLKAGVDPVVIATILRCRFADVIAERERERQRGAETAAERLAAYRKERKIAPGTPTPAAIDRMAASIAEKSVQRPTPPKGHTRAERGVRIAHVRIPQPRQSGYKRREYNP